MGNLIDEVGVDYITQFFGNAGFVYQGNTYVLNRVYGDSVNAVQLVAMPMHDSPEQVGVNLPVDAVDSIMKFAWPKLGYRNIINSQSGVMQVVQLTSQRSTRRGLSADQLIIEWPEAVTLWNAANSTVISAGAYLFNAFNPKYVSYKEALRLLANNKAVAVALNEDICITQSVSVAASAPALYDIYFKGKVVGHVLTDGRVVFSNTSMLRMKFLSKVFTE